MSILSHRDEFLDLYKYSKNKEFEPSKPTKETDILGFTYTNKSNEVFQADKEGMTIWLKNGDMVVYYPKQEEAENE